MADLLQKNLWLVMITCIASATWVDCNHAEGEEIVPSTPQRTLYYDGCVFVSRSTLTVNAPNVTVVITNGIMLPSNASSLSVSINILNWQLAPISTTVSNMRFGLDACLFLNVVGRLPPSSTLIFANNTFALSKVNELLGQLRRNNNEPVIAAIFLGTSGNDLLLSNSSKIVVANNTASFLSSGDISLVPKCHFACVQLLWTTFGVSTNSLVAIDNNRIRGAYNMVFNVSVVAYAVTWYSSASMGISVSNGSLISINDNTLFEISSGTLLSCYSVNFDAADVLTLTLINSAFLYLERNGVSSVSGQGASSVFVSSNGIQLKITMSRVSISNNYITNASLRGDIKAVFFNGIKEMIVFVQARSQLMLKTNRISNCTFSGHPTVVVHWYGDPSTNSEINIEENSLMLISGTSVISSQGASVYGVFIDGSKLSVNGNSTLTVRQTAVTNVKTSVRRLLSLAFANSIIVQKYSKVNLEESQMKNIQDGENMAIDLVSPSITIYGNSFFTVANNVLVIDGQSVVTATLLSLCCGTLSVQENSGLQVQFNQITSRASYQALFNFSMTIQLTASNITIAYNTANLSVGNSGPSPGIAAFLKPVYLDQKSMFDFHWNSFYLQGVSDGCPPVAAAFSDKFSGDLSGSVLRLASNQVVQTFPTVSSAAKRTCPWMLLLSITNIDTHVVDNQISSRASVSFDVRFSQVMGLFNFSGNSVSRDGLMSNRQSGSLLTFESLNMQQLSILEIQGNHIRSPSQLTELPFYSVLQVRDKVSDTRQVSTLACGNVFFNQKIDRPRLFINSNLQFADCRNFTRSSTSDVSESVSDDISASPSMSTGSLSSTLSLSNSATSQTNSMSYKPADPTSTKYGTQTLSATPYQHKNNTETLVAPTESQSIPVQQLSLPILIPMAVPSSTTTTISVAASAVGGATAAADAQTIAVVGLVSCASKGDTDENENSDSMRALSIVALDGTCQGVLLGNTIVVAAAAFLSVVAVAIGFGIEMARIKRSALKGNRTESLSTESEAAEKGHKYTVRGNLIAGCAMVRAPQLLLSVCVYFLNSFVVCGVQLSRQDGASAAAGILSLVFSIVVIGSFPLITMCFGTRRLQLVRYTWKPKAVATMASFLYQSLALDPSIMTDRLFGCVLGAYRRLGCLWTLAPHISTIASLPMILATRQSGTCGGLFALSAALFMIGAIGILLARPRRVIVADVLHSVTLFLNGLVLIKSALLTTASESDLSGGLTRIANEGLSLESLGTAITVLTVIRMVHSISSIALALLLNRGYIAGVEVEECSSSSRKIVAGLIPDLPFLRLREYNLKYVAMYWSIAPVDTSYSDMDGGGGIAEYLLTGLSDYAGGVGGNIELPIVDAEPSKPEVNNNQRNYEIAQQSNKSSRLQHVDAEDFNTNSNFLTEDERFRHQLARECAQRHLDELFHY